MNAIKMIYRARIFLTTVFMLTISSTSWGSLGGVSGGGGNLISPKAPLYPINPELTEKLIHKAHKELQSYLSYKKNQYINKQMPAPQRQAFEPLFTAPEDAEMTLTHSHIDIQDDSSCFDPQMRAVDGSFKIQNSQKSICISAWTISQKSEASDIKPQSQALILHEVGETLGLTETQANQLQQESLIELRTLQY